MAFSMKMSVTNVHAQQRIIMTVYLILILFFVPVQSIIYQLNVTEYNRMPPIFKVDNYEQCMEDPNALYCVFHLELVSDKPSSLLDTINEYSKDTVKHFNHTHLERTSCVTTACKKFYRDEKDVKSTLEQCFNESLWNEYNLKGRLTDDYYCLKPNSSSIAVRYEDIGFAVICAVVFALNFVGTLYDLIFTCGKNDEGIRLLVNFSVRRNWRRLITTKFHKNDSRRERLKSLYGIRSIMIVVVIMAHSGVASMLCINNTHDLENAYYNFTNNLFFNSLPVVQAFFIISGMLLVYGIQRDTEKHNLRWKTLPKYIFNRWWRITASFAVALAFTTTWQRYLGFGPYWNTTMMQEVRDCRKTWWHHLLYINNYFDGSQCYMQTWYTAADMQFSIMGYIICFSCKSTRSKLIVLSLLAIISIISPGLHIYYQDLDAIPIISPTIITKLFMNNLTYDILHRRSHTNAIGYVIGMILGLIVYRLQKSNFNLKKFKKYIVLYWCCFPLIISLLGTAMIFYIDGPRYSLLFRVIYGSLMKPVLSIFFAVLIFGFIFQYEDLYRSIVEWNGWQVIDRLGYPSYIIHVIIIKTLFATRTTTIDTSLLLILEQGVFIILITYIIAIPFWLLIDSPLREILNLYKSPRRPVEVYTLKTNAPDNNENAKKEIIQDPKGYGGGCNNHNIQHMLNV